jgi:hypothetical protein
VPVVLWMRKFYMRVLADLLSVYAVEGEVVNLLAFKRGPISYFCSFVVKRGGGDALRVTEKMTGLWLDPRMGRDNGSEESVMIFVRIKSSVLIRAQELGKCVKVSGRYMYN